MYKEDFLRRMDMIGNKIIILEDSNMTDDILNRVITRERVLRNDLATGNQK